MTTLRRELHYRDVINLGYVLRISHGEYSIQVMTLIALRSYAAEPLRSGEVPCQSNGRIFHESQLRRDEFHES